MKKLLWLMVLAVAAAAPAAVLRVSQSGTGDYLTLGTAYAAAANGDTILIHSGVYNESLFSSKRLTILGAGIDQVTFQQQFNFTTGSNRSIMEGVSVESPNQPTLSISGSADSIVARRSRFTATGGNNCIQRAGASGVRLILEDCIIVSSFLNHAGANGVSCGTDTIVIRNCIFARPISNTNFAAAISGNPNSLAITNCVFLGSQRLFSLFGSGLVVFSNNLAYHWVTATAPTWGTYPVSAMFHYNAASTITPPGSEALLLTANPFVNYDSSGWFNYGTSDLHLAAGTPAIDAGNPSLFDLDSTRSDLGAFGGPIPFVPSGAPAYPFTVSVTLDNPIPSVTDTVHVQSIGRIGPRY